MKKQQTKPRKKRVPLQVVDGVLESINDDELSPLAADPDPETKLYPFGRPERVRIRDDGTPEPYYGTELNPDGVPKKHEPGSLEYNQAVWYRGECYYVEDAPKDWLRSRCVRISSVPLKPPQLEQTTMRETFCVHADLLTLAPVTRTGNVLTPVAAARRETQKTTGARDVGDEVAVLLRACKSLEDVYEAGAKYLGVPVIELHDKYAHLNNGQQRMNIGNRMRAKWKKDNK